MHLTLTFIVVQLLPIISTAQYAKGTEMQMSAEQTLKHISCTYLFGCLCMAVGVCVYTCVFLSEYVYVHVRVCMRVYMRARAHGYYLISQLFLLLFFFFVVVVVVFSSCSTYIYFFRL